MVVQQRISVRVLDEKEGYYHHMHPLGANTLCGWVDVQYEEHSAVEHPITCPSCKEIVSFCKGCSGPYEEVPEEDK